MTLEDQLICGALQTLNEEACEDVLEETEDVKTVPTVLSLPEGEPGEQIERLLADYTCIAVESDDECLSAEDLDNTQHNL